jgi:membrane protease YdiL (CAAX protease family)
LISGPDGRIRWGWRLLLFVSLVFAFAAVSGRLTLWLVGAPPDVFGTLTRGLLIGLPAAVAASWVMMSAVESRSLAALGLVPADFVVDSARGLAVGGLLVAGALGVLQITGALHWELVPARPADLIGSISKTALILGLAAFLEEILFRGYALQVVGEALGPVIAVGLTAMAFGAAHAANPGVGRLALLNTALAGILLGILYWRTFSIWLVTGVHLGWNAVMSLAADLPVSGLDLGSAAVRATVTGPEIWTGGSYGPEGGLALTLVVFAGVAWAVRTPRLRRAPSVLALHPLPGMRLT